MLGYYINNNYITITKHKVDIACKKLCIILEICCDCNTLRVQVV